MTVPSYVIKSLGDFARVPADRLTACLEEFALCVEIHRQIVPSVPDFCFTWHDDVKPGLSQVIITVRAGPEKT